MTVLESIAKGDPYMLVGFTWVAGYFAEMVAGRLFGEIFNFKWWILRQLGRMVRGLTIWLAAMFMTVLVYTLTGKDNDWGLWITLFLVAKYPGAMEGLGVASYLLMGKRKK